MEEKKKEFGTPTTSRGLGNSEQTKKQCITPHNTRNYMLPGGVPASPPKFISLEELMKAANGMTNMALAHEIAVNKDFKLEKFEVPENSFQKTVRDTVHKAFWDLLESELAEDPPNYTQALVLLNDVRNGLLELLLPQHTKIQQQISEVLDIDLIKQQADAGTLDFQKYAQYVISVMGKLCAPVRDEKIAELTQTSNVVDVFKGILETIDLMKIDMANFTISVMRPQIQASSVQYEKQKFADFLKIQNDGLKITSEWLGRHINVVADSPLDLPKKISAVVNDAYLELLEWDMNNPFPETLTVDEVRIMSLRSEFRKLTLAGAVLLVTYSQSGPDLCSISALKEQLKNHVMTLLESLEEQGIGELRNILENISVQLIHDLTQAVDKYGVGQNQLNVAVLPGQILEVTDPDHRIASLLRRRIKEFLLSTITSQTAEPMKIPTGLSSLQHELTQLAGSFLRLTSHNWAVFDEYYTEIVEKYLQ